MRPRCSPRARWWPSEALEGAEVRRRRGLRPAEPQPAPAGRRAAGRDRRGPGADLEVGLGWTRGPVRTRRDRPPEHPPRGENAVVAYHPGVRNFKKRLKTSRPKDPFTQQFTNAPARRRAPTHSTRRSAGASTSGSSTCGRRQHRWWRRWRRRQVAREGQAAAAEDHSTSTTRSTCRSARSGRRPDPCNSVKPVPVPAEPGQAGARLPGHRLRRAIRRSSWSPRTSSSVGGEWHLLPERRRLPAAGPELAGTGADLIYGPDGKTYHLQVTKIKRVTSSKPPS